jgi:hypothetical protein
MTLSFSDLYFTFTYKFDKVLQEWGKNFITHLTEHLLQIRSEHL